MEVASVRRLLLLVGLLSPASRGFAEECPEEDEPDRQPKDPNDIFGVQVCVCTCVRECLGI